VSVRTETKGHYQWEAVLHSGAVVDGGVAPQSYARSLGPVRMLMVKGHGLTVKHGIPIPVGAEPCVVLFHGMLASNSEGSSVYETTMTYAFGWENEEERQLWRFGGPKIEFQRREK